VPLILVSCAVPSPAQAPAEPLFRTTTRLVELSVTAHDGKGAPILDLTKQDFTVTEDGKPQPIAIFALEKGEAIGTPARQLPAGFFSNRLEYRGGVPNSATVILIDLLNTPPGYWGRARPRLAEFLRRMDPRMRVAIYVLRRTGLSVLHEFTTDAALLTRKLGDVKEGGLSPEMAQFEFSLGDASRADQALAGSGDGLDLVAYLIARSEALEKQLYKPMDTRTATDALEAIARLLGAVPGRKSLVWLTAGFERLGAGQARTSEDFDRASRALTNASVAVYPVDVRGILALTDTLRDIPIPRGARRAPNRAVRFETGPTERSVTMKELADQTGGRMFFGEEIDKAIPQVLDYVRASYTIAYYPSNAANNGKFRQIRLKVNRSGVKLGCQAGYYAAEPASAGAAEQRKAEPLRAVWSPVDATAIGLDASLERVSGSAPDERALSLHIDGNALLFEPQGAALACRMELLVVQKNAEGRQVESTLDTFDVPATQDKARALRTRGVTHRKALRLKPETAILRIVLRNTAGALGSLSIPLRAL
jgi:VWFA-related protein